MAPASPQPSPTSRPAGSAGSRTGPGATISGPCNRLDGRKFVVGAVEVHPGKLGDARMAVVDDVKTRSLVPFVTRHIDKANSTVRTDGWQAYDQLEREGWHRERHVSKGPKGGRFRPVIPGISLIFGKGVVH